MFRTTCCVLECPSGRLIPSHRFPKNAASFNKWKAAVLSQKVEHLTDAELGKCVVCYKHFLDTDYVPNLSIRKLKKDAVPSQFLKNNENAENSAVGECMDIDISQNTEHRSDNDQRIEPEHQPQAAQSPQPCSSTSGQGVQECQNVTPPPVGECMDIDIPQSTEHRSDNDQRIEPEHQPQAAQSPQPCSSTSGQGVQECQNITPPPVKRRRTTLLASGIMRRDLTPRKAQLYATAKHFRRRQMIVQKQLSTTKARLRDAARYYYSASTQALLSKLTATQRSFIEMQLRTATNKPQGRRYTLDEKILCLSLYKQSKSCYKLLSQMFDLPSRTILQALLQKIKLEPGINPFLFQHLAHQAEQMRPTDRICCIMWDEVALKSGIQYSLTLDRFIGLQNYGVGASSKIADTALVFMLRGIKSGWKMPLAFYFSDGQTKSHTIIALIKEILEHLAKTKLKIVASVCDQGSSNVKAINEMLATSGCSNGIIQLNTYKIIPFYDPPHLIKGVRNNLLTKDLEIDANSSKGESDRRYASWKTIELAYAMSNVQPLVTPIYKITDQHILPECINKMRVKSAVQVLSKSFGGFINILTCIDGTTRTNTGPLKMPVKEGQATAEAILFFNDLFDSVNGHMHNPDVPLRSNVTPTSQHRRFWNTAIQKLETMRFVKVQEKTPTTGYLCLKNWSRTLKGFLKLTSVLRNENIRTFSPRFVNQDPLENFFGLIRALGGRNTKPTCFQFIGNFKTLLLNNLTSRRTQGNCERTCEGSLLFTLRNCVMSATNVDHHRNEQHEQISILLQNSEAGDFCNSRDSRVIDRIIKIIKLNPAVADCEDCLLDPIKISEIYGSAMQFLSKQIKTTYYEQSLKTILSSTIAFNFDPEFFGCPNHRLMNFELFTNKIVIMFIQRWSKHINFILDGKSRVYDPTCSFETMVYKKSYQYINKKKVFKKYNLYW